MIRRLLPTAACVLVIAAPVFAQTPAKVDYKRDVQPILKEHCYECHGPNQQMNGFRLDRRRDALRGGIQSDMAPGNAEGTRLYQKLIGTKVGPRMPAGRDPLPADKVAIIKAWIDQGIDWPDELSGERPSPPIDPAAAQILAMLRNGDSQAVQRALRKDPKVVNRIAGAGGASLLMFGALYADVPTFTLMLDLGGNPNAVNQVGATPLMWASDNVDRVRLLLARGADANATSEEGNTPIAAAAARNGNGAVAKLLLDSGAKVPVDKPRVIAQLRAICSDCASMLPPAAANGPRGGGPPGVPVAAAPLPAAPGAPSLATQAAASDPALLAPSRIRAAIERTLPQLEKYDKVFLERTGCVSCHNNSLTTMTQATARRSGYTINEAGLKQQNARVAAYLEGWREDALQVLNLGGGQDVVSYILAGLHAGGYQGDIATDAMVRYLLGVQEPDGRFQKSGVPRAPLEGSIFTTTALTVRSILAYAPKPWRTDAMNAVQRAVAWMSTTEPRDTEDRTFQVFGLFWAGDKGPALQSAAKALLSEQRPDGGWAQLPSMQSDPYATGEVLVALRESGTLSATDPAFLRGLQFLMRTQAQDGSWFVKTRTRLRIQAQFDLGFPSYGEDTWISAAATNWATTALALAGKR